MADPRRSYAYRQTLAKYPESANALNYFLDHYFLPEDRKDLLAELHYYMYDEFNRVARSDRKPITEEQIKQHLGAYYTVEAVREILGQMESSGRIRAGLKVGTWLPNPIVTATGQTRL